MKVALYRSFFWNMELPDNLLEFDADGKATDASIVKAIDFMESHDAWPNLLDGEELTDEMQINKLEDSQ